MDKSGKELYVVNNFLITTHISLSIKKTMKSLRFMIDLVIVRCKNKFVPKELIIKKRNYLSIELDVREIF